MISCRDAMSATSKSYVFRVEEPGFFKLAELGGAQAPMAWPHLPPPLKAMLDGSIVGGLGHLAPL
jgi:hypothetical protein